MEFVRAHSLDEALDLLAEHGDEAQLLAGGTDVMVQYLHGDIAPGLLIHIERVSGLSDIAANGSTSIGALATHRRLGGDAGIASAHPALAAAARTVGGWQTQSVGTLGGNICNASPAADTVPALLVAGATAVLASRRGGREVSLDDFFLDRRETVCRPDEILTGVELDPLPGNAGEVYLKVGRRGAMEVALVGLALRLVFADDGHVAQAALALCSVAPTPMRVPAAEQALVGSKLEGGALDAAAEAVRSAIAPVDDPRASSSYRIRVVRGLIERAALRCEEAAK